MPTRIPPIDIEIAQGFLPYTDLNLQGDPARNLRIPNDVILALAGIFGIEGGNIPRMAQMAPTGALFVTEAGGGTNDFLGSSFAIGAGGQTNSGFGAICNPVYARASGAHFSFFCTDDGSNGTIFDLEAGFQVLIPTTINQFHITNIDTVAGTLYLYGFNHNKLLPSPAVP